MEFFIKKFEKYINKILSTDEETLYALRKLENKVIAFKFINTKIKFYLFPMEYGFKIDSICNKKPDVLINSTPVNFLRILIPSKYNTAASSIDVKIEGDIKIAHELQKIMNNFEIDLEDPLSNLVGDRLAFQLVKLTHKISQLSLKSYETIIADISEYLRFEVDMLPDELLVEEFLKDVDTIRNDVDRVSQRVAKLNSLITKK